MKAIYGPVNSWRLGCSLGIDLICSKKYCNLDCIYCQQGRTQVLENKRRKFVSLEKIEEGWDQKKVEASDVITLSGTGEPTLAANLDEVIGFLREKTDKPIAIITNSILLQRKEVRSQLNRPDIVCAKLDASSNEVFKMVNRPADGVNFNEVLEGIKRFGQEYEGHLALQIMFMEENKNSAIDIAKLASTIHADEIQLNTPLRECEINPLPEEEMKEIEKIFEKHVPQEKIKMVYDFKTEQENDKIEILRRRSKSIT